MNQILPEWYTKYKFFNSLFLGLSIGSIFTIYTPLDPSIYSIGGIVLALGMLIVARFYHRILNIKWFFRISLFVEIVLLLAIVYFMLKPYLFQTALIVYAGYQITFIFGSYLIRAETLLLKEDTLLTRVDTAKQLGYLFGMGFSYLFYKIVESYQIVEKQTQVYTLHYLLFVVELVVILLILKSFRGQTQSPHSHP